MGQEVKRKAEVDKATIEAGARIITEYFSCDRELAGHVAAKIYLDMRRIDDAERQRILDEIFGV